MKQLDTTFTLENNNFTQLKRTDKAAVYKRETLEGQFVSYEVFAIMTKNDAEIYPNKLAFGRGAMTWAWCPIAEDRANIYFDRMNNGDVPVPQIDPETGEIIQDNTTEVSLDETPEVTPDKPVVVDDPTAPAITPETVVQLTPDGGAVVTVATVKAPKAVVVFNFPVGEFTQAQFATANGLPERGTVWGVLDKLVTGGKLNKTLKKLGKGRPSQIFTVKV